MAKPQNIQAGNWWSKFPEPRAEVPEITAVEVMQMFDDMDIKSEPRTFLLVDVRRTDWEVSFLVDDNRTFIMLRKLDE
jgi:arsenical-resistance protein 2